MSIEILYGNILDQSDESREEALSDLSSGNGAVFVYSADPKTEIRIRPGGEKAGFMLTYRDTTKFAANPDLALDLAEAWIRTIVKEKECEMNKTPDYLPVSTAVKCVICNNLHDIDADTYVSIAGNISIGRNGGIIGNNFDVELSKRTNGEELKLANTTICCRGICFTKLASEAINSKQDASKPTPR